MLNSQLHGHDDDGHDDDDDDDGDDDDCDDDNDDDDDDDADSDICWPMAGDFFVVVSEHIGALPFKVIAIHFVEIQNRSRY